MNTNVFGLFGLLASRVEHCPHPAHEDAVCRNGGKRNELRQVAWYLVAVALAVLSVITTGMAHAEPIGEVDTEFQLLGPNKKIIVEYFDDIAVAGVGCHLSRAKNGGVLAAVGVAEDKAEASIACRQVGPISFKGPIPLKEEVFSQKQSLLFKTLHVVRLVDVQRNTLVYLTYSDRLIDGSPKNSITSVPVDRAQPIPVKRTN